MNQHQTAHYIEKTGAKWEHQTIGDGNEFAAYWTAADPQASPARCVEAGVPIRLCLDPLTRLPSHLEPYRPDARDPGDGYRVPAKQDSCNQPHEIWSRLNPEWVPTTLVEDRFEAWQAGHYRLPASVPFPDEAEALADYVEPEVRFARREESLAAGAAVREQHGEAFQKLAEHERLEARITELESQLARFQWRSPSQKPTEEDMDVGGYVVAFAEGKPDPFFAKETHFHSFNIIAWMPAPKPPVESDCQRIIRQRGLTEEEVRIIRETK